MIKILYPRITLIIYYFLDNRDKFGSVFTLHLDSPNVYLNSAEAVHEAFVKKADSFSNRPPSLQTVSAALGNISRKL